MLTPLQLQKLSGGHVAVAAVPSTRGTEGVPKGYFEKLFNGLRCRIKTRFKVTFCWLGSCKPHNSCRASGSVGTMCLSLQSRGRAQKSMTFAGRGRWARDDPPVQTSSTWKSKSQVRDLSPSCRCTVCGCSNESSVSHRVPMNSSSQVATLRNARPRVAELRGVVDVWARARAREGGQVVA